MAQILYKVKKGDTVLDICLRHNLTWKRFIFLNPDFNLFGIRSVADVLIPGERLIVGYTDPLRYVRRKE